MSDLKRIFLISLLSAQAAFGVLGVTGGSRQIATCADGTVSAGHSSLFEINRSNIMEDESMLELGAFVDSLQQSHVLKKFVICGYSSPDGPEAFNAQLAGDRARAVQSYFEKKHNIPASMFEISSKAEDWDKTRELVSSSSIESKSGILSIIDKTVDPALREKRLRKYGNGNSWRILARDIFPKVRRAEITLYYAEGELHAVISDKEALAEIPESVSEPGPESVSEPETAKTESGTEADEEHPTPEWQRHAYVKTNIPAWFLIWTNVAGEYDIAPHWSVNLSVYYSGFDYFQHRRKYRTFALMPEIRYWPDRNNQGFFVAPHFGMAWYNVAFEGKYRYQDHDGTTPALGGGVNAGFRFNVSRNRRWRMELSVGFGIYHLDYDLFINERNGLLAGRRKRTFYGVDNAALSICYMFDVKKKGGKK